MELNKSFILVIILLASFLRVSGQSFCVPVGLRCEYQDHPIAIDVSHPRLSWRLKDDRRGAMQTAYQIIVASTPDLIKKGKPDLWNTGVVHSSNLNAIPYEGRPLASRKQYYWRVSVWDKGGVQSTPSNIASFETGIFKISDWKGYWINGGKDDSYRPAPYFRKRFLVKSQIKRAKIYICGLGYYVLFINGERVGDHVLDPGYTRFDKTDLYVAYDVTSYLHTGENTVGVILGNGWYNEQSIAVWHFDKAPWRGSPELLCNMYLTTKDGKTRYIASDTSWKVSDGPIVFDNIYSGEYIDDRLEIPGWDTPAFNDSSWASAAIGSSPYGELKAQQIPPSRITKDIKPVSIRKFNDSTYIFDLGQNFAGLSRLQVSGAKGTVIRLKHGEFLYPDGMVDTRNISGLAKFTDSTEKIQTDRFILKGGGTETFQQNFTYHGFRYIEVTSNKPIKLGINSITGLFVHTDLSRIGQFSCSDTLLNAIYKAGIWTYLSNLQSIPTDCPTREKNGWAGDGHIAAELGLNNFDGVLLYEKWMGDFADAQKPNGLLPVIVPSPGWGYWGGDPAWCSGFLIVPWYIYLYYGDPTLIRLYYSLYKKYVDFLTFQSHQYLINYGLGDWLPYKAKTPNEFTSSCYYYLCARLMSRFAILAKKNVDEKYYSELAGRIKKAINDKYLNRQKMVYANGSQTALSAGLFMHIAPEDLRKGMAENLSDLVRKDGDHLDVGVLGSKYLLNVLSDNGYNNLAFKVADQRTLPSWGYWITTGQTTFMENWAYLVAKGSSRNHVMFGDIVAWMSKHLVGILADPDAPGFKHIILKPSFVKGLTCAEASHRSIYGLIRAEWERKGNTMVYDVTIPANTTATLHLPMINRRSVYESGKLITDSNPYIKAVHAGDGATVYNIASGTYKFEIR